MADEFDAVAPLIKGFAETLAASGASVEQINEALKLIVPTVNEILQLNRSTKRIERKIRTLAQVREPRPLKGGTNGH